MKRKKVLIACEKSGKVRAALRYRGINAWSCDLQAASDNSKFHLMCDVLKVLNYNWDMIIAFPPCTHLAVSGAKWFKEKQKDGRQQKAIKFFMMFVNANCKHIAIEQPISIMSTKYRKPNQIIQPWMFGHGETKATCLWLKNLPDLKPTNIVKGRESRIHNIPPSKERGELRSITYSGIAKAIAIQWGDLLL